MKTKIPLRVIGAIVATGLMSFCGVVIETAMNITFPTLMREFEVSTNTVQWMTTLYLLVVAVMVPMSAVLKRRFKTRHLFLCAIALFMLGVVLDAVAPSFSMLLIGRGVQGLGTGIALPLMFNIILEQVPRPKIGMMMGVGTMITGVAPAVGPTFGGIVVATLDWRMVFVLLLPLLIVALVLGVRCIDQAQPTQAVTVDGWSVLLIVLGFGGAIFGISNWGGEPFWQWGVAGALAVGVVALAGLVWRSLHLTEPIINLRLFGQPRFSVAILAFVGLQISALGLSFLLPNVIQLVNHQSALVAGLIVLPGAAIGAVMGPLGGRLFDARGPRLPMRLGTILTVVGSAVMLGFAQRLSDGVILGSYILFMVGMGLSYGNMMTLGLQPLEQAARTDGNAIFNTLQQFAAAVGTSLVAAIVAAAQQQAPLVAGTRSGAMVSLVVLTGLLILSAGLTGWLTARQS